jgi:hypothetical protein
MKELRPPSTSIRALEGDPRIEAVFPGEESVVITLNTASQEQKPETASASA